MLRFPNPLPMYHIHWLPGIRGTTDHISLQCVAPLEFTLTALSSSIMPSWLKGLMNKNVIMALRTARPLPIQKGPVFPFAVSDPPKAITP